MEKKTFFTNHSKSSAVVVSLIIHAIVIVAAISFVVVKTRPPKNTQFEGTSVKHKQPTPPPPRVPIEISKQPNPKLNKPAPIPVKDNFVTVNIPEITTTGINLGPIDNSSIDSFPDLQLRDSFGDDKPSGNELVGTFYDLKQTSKGKPTEMDNARYIAELNKFANGWNLGQFRNYFRAPKQKYASFFLITDRDANAAPKAYGVDDVVKPRHWVAYYTGNISAPETGHYRFCGFADDVLLVRVRGRLVLDASHQAHKGKITQWDSDDDRNRRLPLDGDKMVIGDWVKLTKDKPMEIEILLGECPGGRFSCMLLIEQKGKKYKQAPFEDGETRPVLPAFKTKEIPKELIEQIEIAPNEATLEGASFGVLK